MHKKKKKPAGVITKWHSRGLGEPCCASLFCHILNDNGIRSLFQNSKGTLGLFDVPLVDWENNSYKDWVRWYWTYKLNDVPIIHQQVEKASVMFSKKIIIHKNRDHVPVIFKKMNVPKVDVALNTETGSWTPYKSWPYFKELKAKMKKLGITYHDLDGNDTYGIKCLNVVKRAQLYVGLDTGMAHYVSRFARGKALIISGGFVSFNFWGVLYNYEPIRIEDVPCRPCYKNKKHVARGEGCPFKNRCMREITVNMVLDKIRERLGK